MTGWPAAAAESAFHGPAGEFVLRTEPHSEAHPMALLAQFLVAFGTACGRGAHYTIEADEDSYVIHEGPGDVKSRLEVFDFRNRGLVAVRHGSPWSVGGLGLCPGLVVELPGELGGGQAPCFAGVGDRRRLWGA